MRTIKPIKKVQASLEVPGDKSISHRALMLLSIGTGTARIKGLLKSDDVLSTLRAFQSMGIDIYQDQEDIVVKGKGLYGLSEPPDVLDLANSGTTIRLLTGILAGQPFMSVVTGDDSLRKRPMGRIIEPLQAMDAKIYGRAQNQKAPLVILKSSLRGGEYKGNVASAQVKSALLLASLYQRQDFIYTEPQQTRDHTERMMKYLGIPIEVKGLRIHMSALKEGQMEKEETGAEKVPERDVSDKRLSNKEFLNKDIEVPGDLSSAAFFMALAAARPGFDITLRNVGINPTRTGMIEVIQSMGASVEILNKRNLSGEPVGDIRIIGKTLKNINITREMIPSLIDELPIIAVLASQAEGDMEISGAGELKVKESNRITAMIQEMGKIGVKIEEMPEGMRIYGNQRILGGEVNGHNDHRIAMSMAIAGLLSEQGVKLTGEDCISVSYPGFFEQLETLRER